MIARRLFENHFPFAAEMLRTALVAFAAMATLAAAAARAQEEADGAEDAPKNDPLNAVVKLEVSTAEADVFQPWRTDKRGGDGSGVVIGDGRILTCAHCVSDATFIRVRKPNEDAIYHATVEFIGNESDLALVAGDVRFRVDETDGGDLAVELDFRRGRRLRVNTLDAAGVTFYRSVSVDETGARPFEFSNAAPPAHKVADSRADVADGRVDGVGEQRFTFLSMESESKRRAYGMKPGQTGVSVTHVDPTLGDGSVRAGDVLLEIGGYKVANNGNIRIEGNEIRSVNWPVYVRQLGETVPARVLRDGVEAEVSVPVSKRSWRIRPFLHDRKADWFLVGGLAFSTVSFDWLGQGRSRYREDPGDERKTPGEELVVLCSTFPDSSIEGYLGWAGCRVDTVNGVKVLNLRHLAELVDGCTDEFIRFGMDDNDEWNDDLVVDAAQMREATPRVMERYAIPADRSSDLREGGGLVE